MKEMLELGISEAQSNVIVTYIIVPRSQLPIMSLDPTEGDTRDIENVYKVCVCVCVRTPERMQILTDN